MLCKYGFSDDDGCTHSCPDTASVAGYCEHHAELIGGEFVSIIKRLETKLAIMTEEFYDFGMETMILIDLVIDLEKKPGIADVGFTHEQVAIKRAMFEKLKGAQ